MGVVNKRKNKGEAAGQKASVSSDGVSQGKRSPEALKAEEQRQKVMAGFHPSVVDWFKEKLDINLSSMPVSELYKLQRGEYTSPQRVVVIPLAYDSDAHKNVEMPKVAAYVSLRAVLPSEKGQPVALDADHKVFLQTVPCRPMVELAAPGESLSPAPQRSDLDRETSFTKEQKMALEGIGIAPERLFGGFNYLSKGEKLDILDGEIFSVDGVLKTDFGFVNVIGDARLSTGEDGKASVVFEPYFPEVRSEGQVVDLERARVIGNLELDLFKRTPDNRVMRDVNNAPMLNRAGENLLEFGVAMEPVKGYKHGRERGEDGKWKETVSVAEYNVRVINGTLSVQQLFEKDIEKKDGTTETMKVIPNARLKDDKVFIVGESKPLAFRTDADRIGFLTARGGMVSGVTFKDFNSKKTTVYDAFVVPMESGYGKAYSPSATEKILAKREAKENRTARRKVRFGKGL